MQYNMTLSIHTHMHWQDHWWRRKLASCIGSLDGRQSNRVGKEAEVGQRTHVKNDRTGIPARPVFSRIVLIVWIINIVSSLAFIVCRKQQTRQKQRSAIGFSPIKEWKLVSMTSIQNSSPLWSLQRDPLWLKWAKWVGTVKTSWPISWCVRIVFHLRTCLKTLPQRIPKKH